MEFIWIIIGIIWFVVSISNKAQKEQQKQRQQANRQQPVRPGQPRPAQSRMQQPRPTAPRPAVQPAQTTVQREAPQPAAPVMSPRPSAGHTAPKPLEAHMHTPVMGEEGSGTEGMDYCHEYMLTGAAEEQEETFSLFDGEQTSQERSQQLLNGVIMSEILGRRRVRQYGSRRA